VADSTPYELRLRLLQSGYSPLPLSGKRPVFNGWQTRNQANPEEIRLWSTTWPNAENTGILCRLTPCLDVDLFDKDAAEAVQQLICDRFGEHGQVLPRIGKHPKRAFPFKTSVPFAKITVFLMAGSSEQRIEFLGDGQQFVAFGVHPETNEPYSWPCGSVGEIKHEELPSITADEARQLIEDIVELLITEHGYRLKEESKGKAKTGNGTDDGPTDWPSLADLVDHETLTSFAMKLLKSGLRAGAAINMLRGLVGGLTGVDSGRLARRLDEIPDIVGSAEKKIGEPEVIADLGEWDAGDDVTPPKPRGWLYGNIFCRTFISSVIAEGGGGKTALRYAQYLSVATGRELIGEHVFHRGRVLIVSLEDDAEELKRRVFAARLHHGVEASEVKGWLFLSAPGADVGKLMTLDNKGRAVRDKLINALENVIVRRKIDIISLDPFVKTHGVMENDNRMIDAVAQILTDLAVKYNIAVDTPHHVRKGPSDPGNADRGRGASAARDAARLVYSLSTMTPEEAACFGVPDEERKFLIRLDNAKVNIAPPAAKTKWFRLVGVALGNSTDLYPNGDEVQTVESWSPPETWAGLSTQTLNAALDDISAGLRDENGELTGERYSDDNAAKARAAWKAVRQHAPEKTEAQCREVVRQWVKNGVLVRETYTSKKDRKERNGLTVNNAKRPGAKL
jgi:hypothetical protein